jgi:hypothetical protein
MLLGRHAQVGVPVQPAPMLAQTGVGIGSAHGRIGDLQPVPPPSTVHATAAWQQFELGTQVIGMHGAVVRVQSAATQTCVFPQLVPPGCPQPMVLPPPDPPPPPPPRPPLAPTDPLLPPVPPLPPPPSVVAASFVPPVPGPSVAVAGALPQAPRPAIAASATNANPEGQRDIRVVVRRRQVREVTRERKTMAHETAKRMPRFETILGMWWNAGAVPGSRGGRPRWRARRVR